MKPEIGERTLKKWRKEALTTIANCPPDSKRATQAERILRMTQILMDMHLLMRDDNTVN